VPATINAIVDAVRWTERIIEEVHWRWRDRSTCLRVLPDYRLVL